MKTVTKIAPFLILLFLVCACQQSRVLYVIVNTTDDNLALKYKTAACANEFSGNWEPQAQSEADFNDNSGAWLGFLEEDLKREHGSQPNGTPPEKNSKAADCATETFTVNVTPHTAVKIHDANYNERMTLAMLELKGSGGNIKYEGTSALVMENFKYYNNDNFNFFGNSHSVLWYEPAKK